uniref:E-beta-farnesene synthase n=1 Tax=Tanacetum cinerariifolium TaxID=118510 RepID=A0A6L2MQA0_TANCI|nr:E-beta-farnesene synthase [Tanacetum cinerariifolium]
MADVNVNAPADQAPTMAPPTHTNDQILSHIRWVPIGKSNCYLEVERLQSNLIYKIAMDILKHTNFFRAFTASSTIPSIYIQQFWDTVQYDKTAECYKFTKLIIYYLQSKHKFHLRPDSPLHLPNEESVLGYLKFSAKGTKREVFGMPILNKLITIDIQGEQYYKEYLEKVAKHQRYLADEKGSDPDSPAPKPAKAIKKSKPSAPKADLRPPVIKPASSQKPKPKPAPTKSQKKKRKLVTKTFDKPSLAKRSKPGLLTKRRNPTSFLRLIDVSVDEGIPEKGPRVDDEETDIQRAVEESLKTFHNAPRGLLPSMVIREPDSGKFQLLSEVQGKGKEKRRTPASIEPSGHVESSLIYAVLGLTDSASEFDKEVPPVVEVETQYEGQDGPNPGVLTEGHAGPNPSVLTEGQAGSDLGVDVEPQPQSSHVVHVGPNLKHMDLEAMDVSTQPHLEQIDERFTATAYPNVQENLKLTVKEHVILEEPASSKGTLSFLQHLAKDLSFGDLFFNDKPYEADNENETAITTVKSMVSVTIP